jgi:hypothetical protein
MQLSPSAYSASQSKVQPIYSGGIGVSCNQPPVILMNNLIPIVLLAIAVVGVTSVGFPSNAMAGGDPCPDPGHCTCENGILHDDQMPNFSANDGCIECGPASDTNPDGICT